MPDAIFEILTRLIICKELKMNRKLMLGLAMALVLVSGAFVSGHAQTLSGPPACWSFACGIPAFHAKNVNAPATPAVFGSVGY